MAVTVVLYTTILLKRNPAIPVWAFVLLSILFISKNAFVGINSSKHECTFRLVTLNVGQFQNDTAVVKSIAYQLRGANADVILLQEFGLYHKWPNVHSVAADFAEKIGMEHHQFTPHENNIFGVAVFSNSPINNWQKLFEQAGPTNEAAMFSIDIGSHKIWLTNLHLQSFNFSLDHEKSSLESVSKVLKLQQRQVDLLLASQNKKEPSVIAGDFNATLGMAAYESVSRWYLDGAKESGIGWRPSVDWLPLRIDHVFVNKQLGVIESSIVHTASDHHAIVCDFSL